MKRLIVLTVISLAISCSSPSKNINEETFVEQESNSIYSDDGEEVTDITEEAPFDETLPASRYFRVENVKEAYYMEDGHFVLEIEVRNIYPYKFSSFDRWAYTHLKFKNRDEIYRVGTAENYSNAKYKIVDWLPNEIKTLRFETEALRYWGGVKASFDRTPEDIYIELSCRAFSVEDEPEGAFARYSLLDLWKSKQQELISQGKL